MDMDSTPTEIQQSHHLRPSASKLPIKRKTPDPHPPAGDRNDPKPPPFKFHRIWTEPDEIRFLQGLLDCSSLNFSFPRDLGIFYSRFSHNMSQPYSKSQLSEKLRRLRKKFRVISTRLSKGLEFSQLSLHDRALYDLSKRLWHPDHAATSPFNGARNVGVGNSCDDDEGLVESSGLVGVKVDFSPSLEVITSLFGDDPENPRNDGLNLELGCVYRDNGDRDEGVKESGDDLDYKKNYNEDVKLSEVNVEFEGEEAAIEDKAICNLGGGGGGGGSLGDVKVDVGHNIIGEVAAKVVRNVFEECFNDARRRFCGERANPEADNFKVRWQQQRMAELDAFGSRLRLVLEHSLKKQ